MQHTVGSFTVRAGFEGDFIFPRFASDTRDEVGVSKGSKSKGKFVVKHVAKKLFDAHARSRAIIRREQKYARSVTCRQHHALRFAELHFARREISDHDGEAANEFFRWVGRFDASKNRALFEADVEREFDQLLRAFEVFRVDDTRDAQIQLEKIIDADGVADQWNFKLLRLVFRRGIDDGENGGGRCDRRFAVFNFGFFNLILSVLISFTCLFFLIMVETNDA